MRLFLRSLIAQCTFQNEKVDPEKLKRDREELEKRQKEGRKICNTLDFRNLTRWEENVAVETDLKYVLILVFAISHLTYLVEDVTMCLFIM